MTNSDQIETRDSAPIEKPNRLGDFLDWIIRILTTLIGLSLLTCFAAWAYQLNTSREPARDKPLLAGDYSLYLDFEGDATGNTGETGYPEAAVFTAGYRGQGIYLPSQQSRITYPSAGNLNIHAGTVMLWIKPDWPGNSDSYHHFFVEEGNGFHVDNFRFLKSPKGLYFEYYEYDASRHDIVADISDWKAGEWHHVAASWDNEKGALRLFVDGRLGADDYTNKSDKFTREKLAPEFWIGAAQPGDGSTVRGVIDEFRIYPRALTAEEIQKEMNRIPLE
jgi:rhamnogalacturonan endolyase